jgi:hypothetical protein
MVAVGAALLTILAVAYAVVPSVRAVVLGIGPYLLILVCPLSMWLMMKSMHAQDDQRRSTTGDPSEQKHPYRIEK